MTDRGLKDFRRVWASNNPFCRFVLAVLPELGIVWALAVKVDALLQAYGFAEDAICQNVRSPIDGS